MQRPNSRRVPILTLLASTAVLVAASSCEVSIALPVGALGAASVDAGIDPAVGAEGEGEVDEEEPGIDAGAPDGEEPGEEPEEPGEEPEEPGEEPEEPGEEPEEPGEDPEEPVIEPGIRDFTTDKSRYFGNSRCAGAGVLLCDGFEGDTIDTSLWQEDGNAPTIDTTFAARGAHSLHFRGEAGPATFLRNTSIFPVENNTYFGRAFVFMDALPTASQYAHWTLFEANGDVRPGPIRVGGQMDNLGPNRFGVGTDARGPGGTGDWTNYDQGDIADNPVPIGEWVCIEWKHDGTNHETAFFANGLEHPALRTDRNVEHFGDTSNPYLLPEFRFVRIGWQFYNVGADVDRRIYDIWMDEVVFDTERIGCVL